MSDNDKTTVRLIDNLVRLSEEQLQRDLAAFEQTHGRPYDGSSDTDWDALGKDHTILEGVVNVLTRLHVQGQKIDVGPVTLDKNAMSASLYEYYTRPRMKQV